MCFNACAICSVWTVENILESWKSLEFQREVFLKKNFMYMTNKIVLMCDSCQLFWPKLSTILRILFGIWSEIGIGRPKMNSRWELKHRTFFQHFLNLLCFFNVFSAHVCCWYCFIFSFLHCLAPGLEPEIIELIIDNTKVFKNG